MREMKDIPLSPKLVTQLRTQGWTGEAVINVESCANKMLHRYQLEMSPIVRSFLQRFGGLAITDRAGVTAYLTPMKIKTREARGATIRFFQSAYYAIRH
ncbi:MAG: hypothetical protein Aurels2KO_44610 [Aureliella sp.]